MTDHPLTTREASALARIKRVGYLNEFSTMADYWFETHSVPGGSSLVGSRLLDNRIACRLIDKGAVVKSGDFAALDRSACRVSWYVPAKTA